MIRFRTGFGTDWKSFVRRLTHSMTNNGQATTAALVVEIPRFKISRHGSVWRTQRLNLKKIKEEKFLRLRPLFRQWRVILCHVYGRRQFRPKKGKKMFGPIFRTLPSCVLFMASRQPHSSVRIPRYRTHHPPE
jgi:hypothetical protein